MEKRVHLTNEIFKQLEAIRAIGTAEMFDVGWVIGELTALGHTKALLWVNKNPHTYSRLLLHGYVIGDVLDMDSGEEVGPSVVEQLEDYFAEDDPLIDVHCPQCLSFKIAKEEIASEEASESIDELGDYDVRYTWASFEYTCQQCGYVWHEDESDSFVI